MAAAAETAKPAGPVPEAPPSRAYTGYVLVVLSLMNLLNHVDRNIVSVLLQQIREEFHASDEWMGLLTGMAFMLVHATMGIPIALWADRGSRRGIVALGLAVWSAMTALSGWARSFGQLLFLRMGVGIGEAAGSPASHSMISDYCPPERRATALAIQAMGLHAGVAFGYLAARYDLEQVGISGLSPEEEPSPADLAAVTEFVEANDVRTIYFETLVGPAVAQTVAAETGAVTAVLDPIEGLSDDSEGENYLEVMRSNLANLESGQSCA